MSLASINYLSVIPDLQRKGLASQMIGRADLLRRAAGCTKISPQIRESNLKVSEFYKTIGFKIDDVVSMWKLLEVDEACKTETAKDGRKCSAT